MESSLAGILFGWNVIRFLYGLTVTFFIIGKVITWYRTKQKVSCRFREIVVFMLHYLFENEKRNFRSQQI